MKVEDKLQILKFISVVFNAFFLILGISIFSCAVWILLDKSSFFAVINDEKNLRVVAIGLAVIGLVVMGVTFLGCLGTHLESRCCLALYMGFLIVIILGELFVTFVLLINRAQIEERLKENIDDIIAGYGVTGSAFKWDLLDNVQRYGKCCGRRSPGDWQNNTFIGWLAEKEVYPCSCFNTTRCPVVHNRTIFGMGVNVYPQGCEQKMANWLSENATVIVAMDLGLLLIQVIQIIVGVPLFKNIGCKAKRDRPGNLISSQVYPETLSVEDY